jgi:hypothetical protein
MQNVPRANQPLPPLSPWTDFFPQCTRTYKNDCWLFLLSWLEMNKAVPQPGDPVPVTE